MTVFWERFLNLCSIYKITPNAAAKRMGISSGTVTNWKNGAVPQPTKIKTVAKFFGIEEEYLLATEEERAKRKELVLHEPSQAYNEKKLLSLFAELSEIEQLKLLLNLTEYVSSKNEKSTPPLSSLGLLDKTNKE